MQIVIDISEDDYRKVQDGRASVSMMRKTITNGTHLQRHGRLIDADKTISKICGSSCGCHLEECGYDKPCFSVTRIESAQTIIEADKESEDKE